MSGGIFVPMLKQFRCWYVMKFMEVSPSVIFDIDFLHQTIFNEKDVATMYKDSLALGGSVFSYVASTGQNQFKWERLMDLEEALDIKSKLKPPQSTYTSTGEESEAGRPEKNPEDRSSVTNDQRDKGVDKSRSKAEK